MVKPVDGLTVQTTVGATRKVTLPAAPPTTPAAVDLAAPSKAPSSTVYHVRPAPQAPLTSALKRKFAVPGGGGGGGGGAMLNDAMDRARMDDRLEFVECAKKARREEDREARRQIMRVLESLARKTAPM